MLEIHKLFRSSFFAIVGLSVTTSAAYAGDGNQIYILQQNSSGLAAGNILTVDQSMATKSLVAGAFRTQSDGFDSLGGTLEPATQDGVNNNGQITVSDTGGQIVFLQKGTDNDASVSLSGALGMAYLEQNGVGNLANLAVDSMSGQGTIRQIGNNNFGDLTVSGENASGELIQKGNNNNFGFTVSGASSVASYTAIGNNMAPVGTGPMVISNGGAVTITQTQLQSR